MSKKTILFSLFALVVSTAFSIDFVVKERIVKFDGDRKNALVVEVVGLSEDDLVDAWYDKMKDLKGDVDKKRDEVIALETLILSVFELPTSVYAKAEKEDRYVRFSVAMVVGRGHLNSQEHPNAWSSLTTYVVEFIKEELRKKADKAIKEAQEALEDEQEDFEKLQKDKAKLQQKIVDWKEEIKQAESDVIVNEAAQKAKLLEIEKKRKALEAAQQKKSQI